jgi:hypothetical protein
MYSMSCHQCPVAAQSVFEADTSQRQKALQDFDLQAVDVVGWEGYDKKLSLSTYQQYEYSSLLVNQKRQRL